MSDVINIGKKFVDLVSLSGIPVKDAYLFGSFAKGNPHKDSDIDICIVSEKLGKDFIDEMVMLRKISLNVDIRIEPIPYSPSEISEKFDPLAHEIRTYGIRIDTN